MPAPLVLALIPARGGSKGLPRKNLRLLNGHPLVAYAIAAGLQARGVTRTLCSTDDEEIAHVAKRYGAEVPFLRPAALASDRAGDLSVFQHALAWLRKREGWTPDLVVHLRPTSPLRPAGLVDRAIGLLNLNPTASAARTVIPAPANPYKMWRLAAVDHGRPRPMTSLLRLRGVREPFNAPRQRLPDVWWQTGSVDVTRRHIVEGGSMTGRRLLPLRMDRAWGCDIDSLADLRAAEACVETLPCVQPSISLPWRHIRMLVVDVDGTLTPGTMFYSRDGERLKAFHTHDGQGLRAVMRSGVRVVIMTGEETPFAAARARKLGISDVLCGVAEKGAVLRRLCERRGIALGEVAYVGDDIGDRDAMEVVSIAGGISCAVSDARPEILAVARFRCTHAGGHGAVRDVCDRIVAARASLRASERANDSADDAD